MLFSREKIFILFFISFLWLIGIATLYPLWVFSSIYPLVFSYSISFLILAYILFKIIKNFSFFSFKKFIYLFLLGVKWAVFTFLCLLGFTALNLNIFISLFIFLLALVLSFFTVPYDYKKI